MTLSDTGAWYKQAFQQEYLDLYLHRDLAEAARAVKFLEGALALDGRQRLLDLCCGPGRHLTLLRNHASLAVGIDLSRPLLLRAQEHGREVHAEAGPAGEPRLARADMRRLPLAGGAFDRVVNLFTSFGYFDSDAENRKALGEIARVLAPGGLLAFDHINKASLLERFQPHSERTLAGGGRAIEQRRWDQAASRVVKQVRLIGADGATKEWAESVGVYEPDALEGMLREAGLQPLRRYGDYDGSAWNRLAPRLIVIAERG